MTFIRYFLRDYINNLKFEVFDIYGRSVFKRDIDGKKIGLNEIILYKSNLPRGIYFYRLTGKGLSITRKMMID